MSERRGRLGGLALWLAWWAFWMATFYIGIAVQTWAFGDKSDPKPPMYDLVGPLHFWFPASLFLWPVWVLLPLLRDAPPEPANWGIAAAAWSAIVSATLVWTERRLLPRIRPPISAWVLAGAVVALVALRLLAPPAPPKGEWALGTAYFMCSEMSFVLLTALVVGTYAAIAIGLVVLAMRWARRRLPARG